jgi:endonuclease YncB( thermonuclease family)
MHTVRPRAGSARLVLLLVAAGVGTALLFPTACEADRRRVTVPKHLIRFDDGDTVVIDWTKGREEVRILSIDAPEIRHLQHDIPFDQPFGREATGFLKGCLAVANKVELLRAAEKDRYGRTLGYLFLNGRNYSVLAIEARLAYGPSGRFGDEGLPREYAACRAAAAKAGPLPFEEPYLYRKRMRELSAWMKERGTYPAEEGR